MDADDVRWWCNDAALQTFPPDVIPPKLGVFMGFTVKEGVYRVSCVPAKNVGGKAVIGSVATCEVTVGAPKPPDPPKPTYSPPFALYFPSLIRADTVDYPDAASATAAAQALAVAKGSAILVNDKDGKLVVTVPSPPLPPTPIPVDGNRVLIVYSKDDLGKIPYDQELALGDKDLITYLNSHCAKGPDGKTPERRLWEASVQGVENESKVWQDAFKRPRTASPWIIVSNGKTGFEGPLPKNSADTLALIKKYLGD